MLIDFTEKTYNTAIKEAEEAIKELEEKNKELWLKRSKINKALNEDIKDIASRHDFYVKFLADLKDAREKAKEDIRRELATELKRLESRKI